MTDLFTPRRKDGKPRALRPPRQAAAPLEFRTCCALADLLRRFCPRDWRWSHFPAGEHRTEATGERLARMGLKKGWPDYLFLGPDGVTRYLEMKRKGNRLTNEQDDFRRQAEPHGIWACAWSLDDAVAILQQWGALPKTINLQ